MRLSKILPAGALVLFALATPAMAQQTINDGYVLPCKMWQHTHVLLQLDVNADGVPQLNQAPIVKTASCEDGSGKTTFQLPEFSNEIYSKLDKLREDIAVMIRAMALFKTRVQFDQALAFLRKAQGPEKTQSGG